MHSMEITLGLNVNSLKESLPQRKNLLKQAATDGPTECARCESEEDAKAMESSFSGTKDNMFMIDVNEETVGKIRVSLEDGQAWIYGFSILPEYQGKGIGRKVLRQIIQEQSSAGHSIYLDVETKNDHALGLYEVHNTYIIISALG
jgi:ribosomal protein S18 acetylase RimI-like enzyme